MNDKLDAGTLESLLNGIREVVCDRVHLRSVGRIWYVPKKMRLEDNRLKEVFESEEVTVVCKFSEDGIEVFSDKRMEGIFITKEGVSLQATSNSKGAVAPMLNNMDWQNLTAYCQSSAQRL